jgi:hypothetical protein
VIQNKLKLIIRFIQIKLKEQRQGCHRGTE